MNQGHIDITAFKTLFEKIDNMNKTVLTVIAIDGGSASGKTTLGEIIRNRYNCTVFHTDDFFLRPKQRTPERYLQPGGNIDYERFVEEVLIPLRENKPVYYRRFDCSDMKILPATTVICEKLVIIEGVYSMHPEFINYCDFSVFLDIPLKLQEERIKKRNSPELANRFFNEWIPLEERYFSKTDIRNRCSLLIPII